MEYVVKFMRRGDVQLYGTLLVMLLVLYFLRGMVSTFLLIIIFAYIAIKVSDWMHHKIKLPYTLAVIISYVLFIGILALAMNFIVPVLYQQALLIPQAVTNGLQHYPFLADYAKEALHRFDFIQTVHANWREWLTSTLKTVGVVGDVTIHVLLSLFISFVFALTRFRVNDFGKQFLSSNYPQFFKNVYYLGAKFIENLGAIIEVQLKIDIINTVLTTVGLLLLGMPSPFVLGLVVFILGLVPVAGVLISMVPLSLMAFATGGLSKFIEVLVLVLVIHMIESYFLHPRLMAGRTHLPVFVTFITLIVMERLLGAWGMIVGVPIVTFLLDILGVQSTASKLDNPLRNVRLHR